MATKQIPIPNITQGHYMSWHVTTQALNRIKVSLKDSKVEYFQRTSNTQEANPALAASFGRVQGSGLQLIIDVENVPDENSLKVISQEYTMVADGLREVAFGYTLLLEDGTDNDYNDLCVSLMAWKTKG